MATVAFPQMNTTGVVGSGSGNVMSGTGGAGNVGYGNSMNATAATSTSANPYTSSTGTSTGASSSAVSSPYAGSTSTVTGENGQSFTSNNAFGQTSRQMNRTLGELQTYYGEGMGSLIYQYLESGGGYNSQLTQQTNAAQLNAMQGSQARGASNLTSQLGAMGVSGASSGTTDALTNYQIGATQQQEAITSQEYYNMWNESQNRELSMVEQVANVNATGTANQSTWMDDLSTGMSTASAGIQMAGQVAAMV
jgi:hypothetical protein